MIEFANSDDGNDILFAGTYGSWLDGDEGNDILVGGLDDDYLHKCEGDDLYLFNHGSGFDSIASSVDEGVDTLRFGPGISPGDVWAERVWSDLILHVDHDNGVKIVDFFDVDDGASRLENIEFSDGTI